MKRVTAILIILLILPVLTCCSFSDDLTSYIEYYNDLQAESPTNEKAEDELKVVFIDVDQGDSALIILPNSRTMLIDSGEYFAKDAVAHVLLEEGITRIDTLIATHPHSDHMGSMSAIIDSFECGDIYLPNAPSASKSFEALLDSIEEKGLNAIEGEYGMSIELDSTVDIEILSPSGAEYESLNNYSIVIRIAYGNADFLFMGDAEAIIEEEILKVGANVSADILKLGHHGSDTSSTEEFVLKVSPQYAIASCGENNTYGHPHESVIQLMDALDITLLRTYENGNITFTTDGGTITCSDGNTFVAEESLSDAAAPDDDNVTQDVPVKEDIEYVYLSKNNKYHMMSCRYYNDSFTEITKEDALAAGYAACKVCKP